VSADASREAFEAWAMSKAGGHQICTKAGAHDIERTYWSFSTDEQWGAWQASRKQALTEASARVAQCMGPRSSAENVILGLMK